MKNLLKKSILALGLISSCCFLSVSAMEIQEEQKEDEIEIVEFFKHPADNPNEGYYYDLHENDYSLDSIQIPELKQGCSIIQANKRKSVNVWVMEFIKSMEKEIQYGERRYDGYYYITPEYLKAFKRYSDSELKEEEKNIKVDGFSRAKVFLYELSKKFHFLTETPITLINNFRRNLVSVNNGELKVHIKQDTEDIKKLNEVINFYQHATLEEKEAVSNKIREIYMVYLIMRSIIKNFSDLPGHHTVCKNKDEI